MDGVVVDSEPVHQQNEKEMFEELGLTISEEEHQSYIGTTARETWKRIIEKHGLRKSIEELFEMGRNRYVKQLKTYNTVKLVAGSQMLIEKLHERDFNVLLASSASCRTIDMVLDHFELRKYFSVVIGADDIVNGKPAPDPFLKAASRAGVDPVECLVIEDSTNGVKAAKSAGMYCIGYQNPSAFYQDLSEADLVVQSMREVTIETIHAMGLDK